MQQIESEQEYYQRKEEIRKQLQENIEEMKKSYKRQCICAGIQFLCFTGLVISLIVQIIMNY